METTNQNSIGSEIGRGLVKTIIAVVGLLFIRLVLDNLPMLKDAHPIYAGGSTMGAANAEAARMAQQFFNTGQMPQNVSEIAKQYALPYIFPVSIANAVVDSLIFAALLFSAAGFNVLIRSNSKRLPEGGLIMFLLVVAAVVALAYRSYSGVIPPLLGSHAKLYGWFFLVLGLLPLIGLVVAASRNLDAITEVVFSSTRRAAVGGMRPAQATESTRACCKCGSAVSIGVKFCGACGEPAVAASALGERFCPGCGAKAQAGAKFCGSCGKGVA